MNLSGHGDMLKHSPNVLEQCGPTFRIRVPLGKVEHIRIRFDPELGSQRSQKTLLRRELGIGRRAGADEEDEGPLPCLVRE